MKNLIYSKGRNIYCCTVPNAKTGAIKLPYKAADTAIYRYGNIGSNSRDVIAERQILVKTCSMNILFGNGRSTVIHVVG